MKKYFVFSKWKMRKIISTFFFAAVQCLKFVFLTFMYLTFVFSKFLKFGTRSKITKKFYLRGFNSSKWTLQNLIFLQWKFFFVILLNEHLCLRFWYFLDNFIAKLLMQHGASGYSWLHLFYINLGCSWFFLFYCSYF